MDKSNIIISIIIVLCIAAAVAAYGLTETNNVFTDLANLDSGDASSDGILGNSSSSSSGSNTGTSTGSGGSSGGGSSGGGSSGGGSSGGGGSGGGGGGSGGGGSSGIDQSKAQQIAQNAISVSGCTATYASQDSGYYYFNVVDSSGAVVDCISVNKKTGATGRG